MKDMTGKLTLEHGTLSSYRWQKCRCGICVAFHSAYQREYRENRGYHSRYSGVSDIPKKRSTSCDLCGVDSTRLNLDHDHASMKFRGWLCISCNTGLGKFGDSVEGLLLALRYLEGK